MHLPSILCPVDFSEASRGALRYAAAVADHFGARLTVMSVDDPLLSAVAASSGYEPELSTATMRELGHFIEETLATRLVSTRSSAPCRCTRGPRR